jgi:hypothetical protein
MSFSKDPNTEQLPLTQAYAAEFYAQAPLPGERELNKRRIEWIGSLIRQGRFVSPTWAVGIVRSSRQRYRLDGQHSSYVLSNLPADEPFPDGLHVNLRIFEFDSLAEDGLDLFLLFNPPESVRNNEDIMGVWRASHPEILKLQRRYLVNIASGLNMYQAGLPGHRALPTRWRGQLYEDPNYRAFAVWAAQFQRENATSKPGRANARFLTKPAIVAGMLDGFVADREAAQGFWTDVFNESHPDPDDDTRTLATALKKLLNKESKKPRPSQFRREIQKVWQRHLERSLPAEPKPRRPEASESAGGEGVVA